MTDVLNTDGPSILNSFDSDFEKKKKLVYTTDYLRQFDQQGKDKQHTQQAQQQQQQHHQLQERSLQQHEYDQQHKDRQLAEYTSIIHKLKGIILHSKDDNLINTMKSTLNEYQHGKQFLIDDYSHRVPSIQNFSYIDQPLFNSYTPFPSNGQPTSIPIVSGQLPPLRSPRKVEIQPIPVTPLPQASQTAAPTFKSPRKQPPPQQLPLQQQSNNSATTTPNSATPQFQTPISVSPSTSSSNIASILGPQAGGAKTMKKSPSMPVIVKQTKDAPAPLEVKAPIRPALKSSNSSSNITNIGLKKDDPIKKVGSAADAPLRKPMTKSVSMSSINTSNINDANMPIKATTLEEITGQIYHLTKYQAGCRFLQKKLEESPDAEHVTMIFKEVYEHLIELMVDPYGQYLIPQLMKYCDNNQRKMIVDKIAPKVETFACHIYGIHGIQKVLQYLAPEQVQSIVDSISDKVISLSKDAKGNYLIQSFLKQFSPEVNQFICNAIMDNVVEICTHKVGCTVVNRCIDFANKEQLEALIKKINSHSLELVQDQFGNYVVQHLLSNNKSYASQLIKSLLGNIGELSVQKYSSNVIEKCLQVADTETYESIIKELMEADILVLLQDKYANFVIQTALDVADDQQHARLVKLIVPYIHQIKTPYVIHIQKKILQV
ncbi:hypothetical protein SAMD00019534_091240 [Acytostelium subglobosum LB1]|uniref:hypothetical protein n=1 Tax=Acytostelium subglobosum LB1 TaxID=1410327 RepID=UPI000644CBE9|nr:hypothetical protein SAMD00019534_091240 [Acytostelium subglobosum LB1]GAM25949.1 hypothetical protein SAMD00019534_091240 [Acytostelium subglobosum LB1]|eukprot:XP_012750992.1 hypothetical protein SAMD00019534_091240 [Acytostelium subglobosum LB1]